MKISTKLNLPVVACLLGSAFIGLYVMHLVVLRQGVALTHDTMRSVFDGAEQTREAVAQLHESKAFDMPGLKAELERTGRDRFRETTLYNIVPIVAAWQNAGAAAKDRGFTFRVVRENPRHPRNAPTPDELRILREVEKPGAKELVERDDARGLIIAARPVVLTADCLICHGDPATSPSGNGRDLLGFPMENWKAGEVRGAFILSASLEPINASSRARTFALAFWVIPFVLLVCAGSVFYVRRSIVRPLHEASNVARAVADGDLTRKLEVRSRDELGDLAHALNTTTGNLRTIIADITAKSRDLAGAATALDATAASQASGTEAINVRASTVAAAGEELSATARSMAEASSRITQSTTGVAGAMEEMSASIQEVAGNSTKGAEISHHADQQARSTKQLMTELDESARQISKIVDIINHIAEQTNLLALNASIEAASAGEAGRGFAVVANEVKALARQSASASEDIRRQIELIQKNATSAVGAIDEVSRVIQQVSQMTSSIAAAVEEQSATVSEVTRSLHEVSSSTSALASQVSGSVTGTEEVSRNIREVSDVSANAAQSAAEVTANAARLNALAGDLKRIVSRFRLDETPPTAPTSPAPGTRR
jgi:methyl-accepting chemotaxis protein